MVWLSNQQVRDIAAQFGHRDLTVTGNHRGYVATCSCGYRSTRRSTAGNAAQAAAHHMQKIAQAARSAGVSVKPQPVAADESEGKGAIAPAAALRAS